MPKIQEKIFLTTRKRKFVDLLTNLKNRNYKLKDFEKELVNKFDMPKISKKNLICTTRKRKFVDLLTKLTNKNCKLKNLETELVDLLTNLTCQKSKVNKFDIKDMISKEIMAIQQVWFLCNLKLVDLLTCKNHKSEYFETQLFDLLTNWLVKIMI